MKNLVVILIFSALALPTQASETLTLPPGFAIETLDFEVPNARQMALTANGTLIVGTRRAGKVYAVPNALTTEPAKPITLLEDLKLPSGVAVRGEDLFIGAVSDILKIEQIDRNLTTDPPYTEISTSLPTETHHGWKYLKFGPDGKLYVPVGAPCNICLSDDERFASLLTMDPVTGATEIHARGIRNTVGFAWHPQDNALWFSENGRDMLGDDVPPEEINVISAAGEHFGYPFVHGRDIRDPEFGDHPAGADLTFTPPTLEIQAHSAALGMTFYDARQFPEQYQNALFIAEHGSWNRSSKVGYQVSVVFFEQGKLRYEPFVTGWLEGERAWGRPNDVLVAPDGSLLISDDRKGRIYRVRYQDRLAAR